MGGTFKRNWEGDYHCTPREIKAMLRDQAEESPDMKVLENHDIEDLDKDSIKSYRIRYNTRHDGTSWTKLSNEEFLVKIGAASKRTTDHKIHPTAAGLLMFGQEYLITTEFPEYFLDYRKNLIRALGGRIVFSLSPVIFREMYLISSVQFIPRLRQILKNRS